MVEPHSMNATVFQQTTAGTAEPVGLAPQSCTQYVSASRIGTFCRPIIFLLKPATSLYPVVQSFFAALPTACKSIGRAPSSIAQKASANVLKPICKNVLIIKSALNPTPLFRGVLVFGNYVADTGPKKMQALRHQCADVVLPLATKLGVVCLRLLYATCLGAVLTYHSSVFVAGAFAAVLEPEGMRASIQRIVSIWNAQRPVNRCFIVGIAAIGASMSAAISAFILGAHLALFLSFPDGATQLESRPV